MVTDHLLRRIAAREQAREDQRRRAPPAQPRPEDIGTPDAPELRRQQQAERRHDRENAIDALGRYE
jgi:hypothetical protein